MTSAPLPKVARCTWPVDVEVTRPATLSTLRCAWPSPNDVWPGSLGCSTAPGPPEPAAPSAPRTSADFSVLKASATDAPWVLVAAGEPGNVDTAYCGCDTAGLSATATAVLPSGP